MKRDNYCNPLCAFAPRVDNRSPLPSLPPSLTPFLPASLSKYSSLISHRPSTFEGRHINHRSSKVDTSIIGLRRSTHPSPKVDTSIFESRHIDLRRSTHRDIDLRRATHRSSKGDTSIFESRHIDLRKSTHRSSKIEGGNITPTIRRRILSTTALLSPWSEVTHAHSVHTYMYKNK